MDTSQDHGAALHGSSSCQVRCCTVQRPQCALLSAADHPRRAGVERSTSSTSSFIASTGTAAACRRPPAQLRRRADATADHMGPVAVQADLVVPPVSFVGPCVCGYRAFFFHFIDEYMRGGVYRPRLELGGPLSRCPAPGLECRPPSPRPTVSSPGLQAGCARVEGGGWVVGWGFEPHSRATLGLLSGCGPRAAAAVSRSGLEGAAAG